MHPKYDGILLRTSIKAQLWLEAQLTTNGNLDFGDSVINVRNHPILLIKQAIRFT
jgi:hypothetical protein